MNIDDIRISFDQDQLFVLNLCLAFIMFGIALDLSGRDFFRILRNPRPTLIGLSSQLILLPLLTLTMAYFFAPTASIALGLILVAACPGGNISNFSVHLAKGNTAMSITMTSIVTILAVIITPLTFSLWASVFSDTKHLLHSIDLNFLDLVRVILIVILLPLIAGMLVNRWLPGISRTIKKPVKVLSLLIFISFIVIALYENIPQIQTYLHIVFLLVLVHNGLALLMGFYYAKAWKLPLADAKAVSLETGVQNSGLGLVLVFNFFQDIGGMMLVVAWWGVWDMITALLLALWWSNRYKVGELQTSG
jgi:BASS family bile acid:Na+ symporter